MNKKKNIIWGISMIGIIVTYILFLYFFYGDNNGNGPIITFENEKIEMSVKDDETILLDDVKAFDEEDGDLTNEIIIESLSPFDTNQDRYVTYAVFDSSHHVTDATRKIHYVDYEKPRIYLKGAFTSSMISNESINKLIGARSCVDGDITQKVSTQIQKMSETDEMKVLISVKDSTGTMEKLELTYDFNRTSYTTDIKLSNYLVYIKVGEDFDVYDNIKSIRSKTVSNDLEKYLSINNNINNQVPGVYEVEYSFNHYGDSGLTKCIVVVEE